MKFFLLFFLFFSFSFSSEIVVKCFSDDNSLLQSFSTNSLDLVDKRFYISSLKIICPYSNVSVSGGCFCHE